MVVVVGTVEYWLTEVTGDKDFDDVGVSNGK